MAESRRAQCTRHRRRVRHRPGDRHRAGCPRGARSSSWTVRRRRPADLIAELGFVTGDISDADSVRRAVHAAADQLGGLDVLVNNAGIGAQGRVQDHTDEDWHRVLDVNVVGTARVTRAGMAVPAASSQPPS